MTHSQLSSNTRTGYEVISTPPDQPIDRTQPLRSALCRFCGDKFLMPVKGRKRIWCSDACKSYAWRYRREGWPYPVIIIEQQKNIRERK